ncbi:sporulation protein [Longispora sp. NPDC051575]|uniref:sporulation protein n=1 Tax=Longispora sp. NPDC051575 TaxID=3154943 RepID=UPI00343CEBE3
MVFNKFKSAFGVGGPSVDTVLTNPNTRPGLSLEGHVHLTGGQAPADIEYITVSLVTRVEVESDDVEHDVNSEFHRVQVTGAFHLPAGVQHSIPFSLPVPWETPITHGPTAQALHGMTVGLRTELSVARAVDSGDLDPVYVHPLPVQEGVLAGLAAHGFRVKSADLERGHLNGVHQTLPFYQEIEHYPAPRYQGVINEMEVTFVAGPQQVEVIFEFDKRGGRYTGHDTFSRFTAYHHNAGEVDWPALVGDWVGQSLGRFQTFTPHHGHGFAPPPPPAQYGAYPPAQQHAYPPAQHGYPAQHGGGHGYRHGGHGQGGHGGHGGPGIGGVVGGVAVGLIGGYVAGEIIDDIFEDDEGEEGDGED